MLCELGDETARAAETQEPHIMARYLLDVCAAFSRTAYNKAPSPSQKRTRATRSSTRKYRKARKNPKLAIADDNAANDSMRRLGL